MLHQIRNSVRSLPVKILLAFLVVSFAVWGVGDMINPANRSASVAQVGDQTITANEYLRAMSREVEQVQRALGGNYRAEMIAQLRLSETVVKNLLAEALWQAEAESMGLTPDDADVVRLVRSNPVFQDNTGSFSKTIFAETLRRSRLSEKDYIDSLRQTLAVDLLKDALEAPVSVPDIAVKTLYLAHEQRRAATFYVLGKSAVSRLAEPSDEEIESFYQSRKQSYAVPEYRTISYVNFSYEDVTKGAKPSNDVLESAYRSRLEEFTAPERRELSQLLYETKEQADAAFALLKQGQALKDVASSTDATNKDALSLGLVEQAHLITEAQETVFALKEKGFTSPIESSFGWHIFQVEKIVPSAVKSFEEVRDAIETEFSQMAREDALNNFANQMEDAVAGGSSLAEIAKEHGLTLHTLPAINQAGTDKKGTPMKDVPSYDRFIDVAFNTDEGTESNVTSSSNGTFYMLRIEQVQPAYIRPLDEVRTSVRSAFIAERAQEKLSDIAQDMAKKLAESDDRAAIAKTFGAQIQYSSGFKRSDKTAAGIDLPPGMGESIFAMAPGDVTGAFALQDGEFVVAQLGKVIPATLSEDNTTQKKELEQIRAELQQHISDELLTHYLNHLGRMHTIEVHEDVLRSLEQYVAQN